MRIEESFNGWTERSLAQEVAARLLGVNERMFRRYIDRYHDERLARLADNRLMLVSHRRASADEVVRMRVVSTDSVMTTRTSSMSTGITEPGMAGVGLHLDEESPAGGRIGQKGAGLGQASQEAQALAAVGYDDPLGRRSSLVGARLPLGFDCDHDDAANEHYCMCFVAEEVTASSLHGVREALLAKGLFCFLYTDRDNHYWTTPKAGGKINHALSQQIHRQQPGGQRQLAVVEHRAGAQAGLAATGRTPPVGRVMAVELAVGHTDAVRTDKASSQRAACTACSCWRSVPH
jgi:hypothetical protein